MLIAKNKNTAGFTLLELLVYVAILGIITVAVSQSFLIFSRGRAQAEARAEVNGSLRFGLERIRRDATQASSLDQPAVAGETSDQLALTVAGESVVYRLVAGRLTRQAGAGPVEALTSSSTVWSVLAATRLENQNQVLNKKKVTLRLVLTAAYEGDNPAWQASSSRSTTLEILPDL